MNNKIFNSIGVRVILAITVILIVIEVMALAASSYGIREVQMRAELEDANHLILLSESVRENMEQKWQLGVFSPEILRNFSKDNPEERKAKILATVPIVTAWETAKAKAKVGGYEFRTPRANARNPANNPDNVEQTALEFFKSNPDEIEYHVVDEKMNAIRYFRPVRLSESCMNCHGDPVNSEKIWGNTDGMDITGYKMDGKKVGDLHGAFEVIKSLDRADAAFRNALITGIIEGIIMIAIGLALVYWVISRLVSKPVSRALQDIASAEENNDLTMQLCEDGKGEITQMSIAFNRFTTRIRDVMGEVVGAAKHMSDSATQLSQITQTTSQAVDDQQAETQQAATAMNEMTATVAEVAQNAALAADSANAATIETHKGETVVKESKDNISQLANEVMNAAQVITQLDADSSAISSILDVIKNIAEQTNLLALNAAIEAARAGDQGRGFAVVADEVRTLAQRTQQSTAEIEAMIERLQSGAEKAVAVMEKGQAQAEVSVEHANKASDALQAIAQAISTIDQMNTQIATAAEEQSSVAEEVNKNVININQSSEQTAENTRHLSTASDELNGLAQQLDNLVSKFKI
ncbi:Methyl-accepting chemotaxis sensor/transducer protein [hydrothermal vent metagenome]|uniref:Methyl-accepting chemotaxis sensor/transducer protein n=1 Tax=hydrothermal vent metagenome TaxID=652676 RepID=A0A3B1AGZ4_9ZZZZ